MTNISRWVTSALALALLLGLTYQVMQSFLTPVLWAVVLVYVTWPAYRWLHQVRGMRAELAALVMTLALSSVAVIPLVWGTVVLQGELAKFLQDLPEWLAQKPHLPQFLLAIPYVGDELAQRVDQFDDLQSLVRARAMPWLQRLSNEMIGLVQGLGRNLAKLGFTALALFFIYRDGAVLVAQIRQVLLHGLGQRADQYLGTAETTVKAVVYGIVLTAAAQGLVAGLGYWGVGVKVPVILGLVTMAVAMVPFGAPVVWGSTSLWLLAQGHHWAAMSLFLWGALVVSWIDNLVRPIVISAKTAIPFLLVLFGVVGGLLAYGFIGLFVGPVILAVAFAAWREWLASMEEQPDGQP
jgi:predicted PurR-regulated permease PerM